MDKEVEENIKDKKEMLKLIRNALANLRLDEGDDTKIDNININDLSDENVENIYNKIFK